MHRLFSCWSMSKWICVCICPGLLGFMRDIFPKLREKYLEVCDTRGIIFAFYFLMDVYSAKRQWAAEHHVTSIVWRQPLYWYCPTAPIPGGYGGSLCMSGWHFNDAHLLLLLSSSSSATATICVAAVRGLLRSILSDVDTLGEVFCIIEQAELETPQGSFRHELDYPWGLFSVLEQWEKLTNRMN